MTRPADVVTLGETMVLLDPVGEGSLEFGGRFVARVAGAESNTAIGLARLGVSSVWVSAVGADPFGRFILSTLEVEDVDVSRVRVDETRPTGVFFKERISEATNVYYYRAGSAAASLTPADVPAALIASSRLLHLSGITLGLSDSARAAVHTAIRCAKAGGVLISVDPNLRNALPDDSGLIPAVGQLVREADIVLGGLEELESVLGVQTAEEVFSSLRDKVVVARLGSEGSLISANGDPIVRLAAVSVDVVDTVGAGDSFNSGFLAAILRGNAPTTAARIGAVVASHTVGSTGDWEAIPRWEEVVGQQQALYPTVEEREA